jgi:hypothetical protein
MKKRNPGKPDASSPAAAPANDPGDWRVELLARIRALITRAEPGMIEERKWRKASNAMEGVPVWSHNGIVCTGETYKNAVKMTFAKGSGRALQFQPRRQHQARHRLP